MGPRKGRRRFRTMKLKNSHSKNGCDTVKAYTNRKSSVTLSDEIDSPNGILCSDIEKQSGEASLFIHKFKDITCKYYNCIPVQEESNLSNSDDSEDTSKLEKYTSNNRREQHFLPNKTNVKDLSGSSYTSNVEEDIELKHLKLVVTRLINNSLVESASNRTSRSDGNNSSQEVTPNYSSKINVISNYDSEKTLCSGGEFISINSNSSQKDTITSKQCSRLEVATEENKNVDKPKRVSVFPNEEFCYSDTDDEIEDWINFLGQPHSFNDDYLSSEDEYGSGKAGYKQSLGRRLHENGPISSPRTALDKTLTEDRKQALVSLLCLESSRIKKMRSECNSSMDETLAKGSDKILDSCGDKIINNLIRRSSAVTPSKLRTFLSEEADKNANNPLESPLRSNSGQAVNEHIALTGISSQICNRQLVVNLERVDKRSEHIFMSPQSAGHKSTPAGNKYLVPEGIATQISNKELTVDLTRINFEDCRYTGSYSVKTCASQESKETSVCIEANCKSSHQDLDLHESPLDFDKDIFFNKNCVDNLLSHDLIEKVNGETMLPPFKEVSSKVHEKDEINVESGKKTLKRSNKENTDKMPSNKNTSMPPSFNEVSSMVYEKDEINGEHIFDNSENRQSEINVKSGKKTLNRINKENTEREPSSKNTSMPPPFNEVSSKVYEKDEVNGEHVFDKSENTRQSEINVKSDNKTLKRSNKENTDRMPSNKNTSTPPSFNEVSSIVYEKDEINGENIFDNSENIRQSEINVKSGKKTLNRINKENTEREPSSKNTSMPPPFNEVSSKVYEKDEVNGEHVFDKSENTRQSEINVKSDNKTLKRSNKENTDRMPSNKNTSTPPSFNEVSSIVYEKDEINGENIFDNSENIRQSEINVKSGKKTLNRINKENTEREPSSKNTSMPPPFNEVSSKVYEKDEINGERIFDNSENIRQSEINVKSDKRTLNRINKGNTDREPSNKNTSMPPPFNEDSSNIRQSEINVKSDKKTLKRSNKENTDMMPSNKNTFIPLPFNAVSSLAYEINEFNGEHTFDNSENIIQSEIIIKSDKQTLKRINKENTDRVPSNKNTSIPPPFSEVSSVIYEKDEISGDHIFDNSENIRQSEINVNSGKKTLKRISKESTDRVPSNKNTKIPKKRANNMFHNSAALSKKVKTTKQLIDGFPKFSQGHLCPSLDGSIIAFDSEQCETECKSALPVLYEEGGIFAGYDMDTRGAKKWHVSEELIFDRPSSSRKKKDEADGCIRSSVTNKRLKKLKKRQGRYKGNGERRSSRNVKRVDYSETLTDFSKKSAPEETFQESLSLAHLPKKAPLVNPKKLARCWFKLKPGNAVTSANNEKPTGSNPKRNSRRMLYSPSAWLSSKYFQNMEVYDATQK